MTLSIDDLKEQLYKRFYVPERPDGHHSEWLTVDQVDQEISSSNESYSKKKSISTDLGQLARDGVLIQRKPSGKETLYQIKQEQSNLIEIRINSFEDFKHYLGLFRDTNNNKRLYFRGEPGEYDHRLPSIYRGGLNNLAKQSDRFYSDLAVRMGDLNFLREPRPTQLARFQHYQAPTRLLDISTNPLMALFFAVESSDQSDCQLFFYAIDANKVKYQTGHTAMMKASVNWIKQTTVNNFMLHVSKNTGKSNEDLLEENDVHLFMSRLNQLSNQIQLFDQPKEIYADLVNAQFIDFIRDTPRMQEQQGAFIMPAYYTGIDDNSKVGSFIDNSITEAVATEKGTSYKVFKISAKAKEDLRKYISILGINAGTAYPDIEHFSRYLRDFYK